MKSNTANKIINPILALGFLWIIATALLHELHLLSGETFEELHPVGGFIFSGAVVLHLIFNFRWIRASYLKSHGSSAKQPDSPSNGSPNEPTPAESE